MFSLARACVQRGAVAASASSRRLPSSSLASASSLAPAASLSGGFFAGCGALMQQVRTFAGRKGGRKRMKRNDYPHTPKQTGFGKKIEFFWPKGYRVQRLAVWENSRQHVLYDNSRKRWMTMWYRHGIQRFKTFSTKQRADKFEKSRQKAIILFHQLRLANKLGTPKPDVTNSGVRGVFMDKWEQAWVARWNDCGLNRFSMFKIGQLGFDQAYKAAVATRTRKLKEQHEFKFQRFRWRGMAHRYGTSRC